MSDEILDIAQGDARLANRLREILESLADRGSDQMREMAREVLGGRSLREMAASSVYGDEVGVAFGDFWARYQELSPVEQAEWEETGRTHLDEKTNIER
ncbi:hypothetical protein FB565_006513 [Actinoplanes lutulentus]|uniref:Uncharacterized protein n=1 Tax=Actinoplanes lutulentus TaxID=1287878 RepID=A0A327ZFG7_9ACTN|nr:hypothetical protein [Actinoplanes lutulentus]MBB2946745.1 hypothetical protein [Actinoplanes lutulentus]RAK35637.1 hypothetical protein B0I29_109110 [Actinoplanes lutulentus]